LTEKTQESVLALLYDSAKNNSDLLEGYGLFLWNHMDRYNEAKKIFKRAGDLETFYGAGKYYKWAGEYKLAGDAYNKDGNGREALKMYKLAKKHGQMKETKKAA